jgi:microcystin-dependent protein
MFEIRDIILLILVIIVIYLLYKKINQENFDATDAIKAEISNVYKVDIDAMRNLAQLSEKILSKNGDLILPSNVTIPESLTVSGNLTGKNTSLSGNVVFTDKDTKAMEIFPKGMVVAWFVDSQPLGWAPCDGNYYKLDNNNFTANKCESTDIGAVLTPDLRSKFIIGAYGDSENVTFTDTKNQNLTTRPYGTVGGEETHKLTVDELPAHNHFAFYSGVLTGGSTTEITWHSARGYAASPVASSMVDANTSAISAAHNSTDSFNYMILSAGANNVANSGLTSNTGSNNGHNNIPPYFSLYYYIKL